MEPEFKSVALSLKAVEDSDHEHGEFEAVLSTPDMDRDGETVTPGAFNPLPKSIPVHFQHDFVDKVPPVGRAVPYYDGDVLKVKGTFASTPRAQELRSLVTEGVIDSMSAGFLTTKRKGKSILQADLIEGSLTATPVNRSAMLLRAKAIAEELDYKAGARNSTTDAGRLQQIHDLAVENGADCPGMKSLEDVDTKAEFSQDQRDKLAKEGVALPDGSFPIRNRSDLENAIQAIGRAKDRAAAMAHIKKRAAALGATDLLPDDWKSLNDADLKASDEVSSEEGVAATVATDTKSVTTAATAPDDESTDIELRARLLAFDAEVAAL